jgi:hypothetical protein
MLCFSRDDRIEKIWTFKVRLHSSLRNAPNREAADRLCTFLQEQTDYNVKVESDGSFLRRRCRVEGSTQNTAVSPAILNQWVTWMVSAGKERACDFNGWGNIGLTGPATQLALTGDCTHDKLSGDGEMQAD